ncbi:sensor domain-containing diguanylate cyclase [Pontibacillus marinus]|uniref:GGDEF domain-containing protein n=1 Tax=Pontibacillus marinus BH030004 = DSM 16465 TaxID=1385511 RepID=A0A0A5FXS5_9BACI|nr:sensor domain-containing diguanylate cyclase [Pontibacillus marinus]KGX85621.1 hypothetical protein N783_14095 [Pontibacillus marinus BH030004 = DSM 16465]
MRKSLEETATYLTNHEEQSDQDIQEQIELLRNGSNYFNSLSWIDQNGVVRSLSPLSVGLKGEKITGVTKKVLDSRQATLTSPYIGPSGRLIVLMSQPLYDQNGTYRGMIGGTIYLQESNVLNDLLGNDIVEENGSYYYVVGPEGKLLFHPNRNRIGQEVTDNPIVQKLMEGESGKRKVTNTIGIPMLAAYSYVPKTGWGVVQQTPVSYIDELLTNNIQTLVLYILPPYFILLLLSILVARMLAKPFNDLANVVNKLASGQTAIVPRSQHWNREADLLTKSVRIAMSSMQESNNKLLQEATTDPLTEIPNRRKMNEVMDDWTRQGIAFSLLAIDIDHFKSINDTYAHQAGDEVLKHLASTLQSVLPEHGQCFRYGGEEFVVLLPHLSSKSAFGIAERIRVTVQNVRNPLGKTITVSIGVAEYPVHAQTAENLFRRADKALYQAKIEGRNRSTIWS